MFGEVSSGDNIIDSRDVIARVSELEGIEEDHEEDPEIDGLDEEERDELAALREFAEEGESATSEWHHGAQFIRESHFEDYAREFAEDMGALPRDAGWPSGYIDWEAAAEALQMDYTSAEFEGVTYYVIG
jgi:antirestriction protein